MSCKGDWSGRDRAKDAARERAWSALEASGAARDAGGPRGRIPDFDGAEAAADWLAATLEWRRAAVVKCNPDPPQAPVRRRALEDGKTLYVPVPCLTADTPFLKLAPAALAAAGVPFADASDAAGAARHGEPVRFDEMEPFGIAVCGTVAAARDGGRLGKGGGFADLEMGVFRHFGWMTAATPVATSVHEAQVVDALDVALDAWDVPLDLVATPGGLVRTGTALPKPRCTVAWDAVRADQLRDIPFLAALRAQMEEGKPR